MSNPGRYGFQQWGAVAATTDSNALRLPALPASVLGVLYKKILKLFLSVLLLFPYAVLQLPGLQQRGV